MNADGWLERSGAEPATTLGGLSLLASLSGLRLLGSRWARCERRPGRSAWLLRHSCGWDAAARWHARGRNQLKVVVGNGVLVFLPQKLLLDQNVDVGWKRVRVLPLEQSNGARVLLPSPNQLFFPLAPGELRPHGERGAHQHRHDAQANQQRGHRVATVTLT